MRKKAPGKAFRKGISLKQIMRMFPDNATAERWFIQQRWPDGVCCHDCGSVNVQTGCKHKTMPFRCREKACGKKFSVKTGTIMEGSKIGYQDWIIAIFQIMTSLKSVSSMKLHRDLGITQKSAWFLAQRLRAALSQDGVRFAGPVEIDETYFGGRRRNMSNTRRKARANTGRGPVGKTAVVGATDRRTKRVAAKVVHATDQQTLQGFVEEHAAPGATVYTDDATAYESLRRWTLVLEAADTRSPHGREALEDLCERYWYPLYVYVRRRGYGSEEAQDLTQGFFAQFLGKGYIKAADPQRGKLRSFLLTSLKNYLANEWDRARTKKRGGGRIPISLDFEKGEDRYHVEPADDISPDKVYEQRWALTLIDQTLERLAAAMDQAGQSQRFNSLQPFLTGETTGIRYRSVADRLGMTEGAVKVAVHRLRQRFGVLLREEVGQTVADSGQVDEEIRYLLSVLGAGG